MSLRKLTPEELLAHPAIAYMNSNEGVPQARVAGMFGVKQSAISFWLKRIREEGRADRLAPWLVESRARTPKATVTATYPVTATVSVPATATADRQGTYHTDIKLQGSQAFATPITSAMLDGAASSNFPEHALALVNPDATPTSGDFVLTLDQRDNATAIKRLQRNGDETLLMSLNPAISPIPADHPSIRIVGVVAEVQHTPYRHPAFGRR